MAQDEAGSLIIPPILRQVVQSNQVHAIREKGFAPDPERYASASAGMFVELLEMNEQPVESVRIDLAATKRLLEQLGPYQNPAHLLALVTHHREILTTARSMGIADDSWVPFASATLGSVNAVTKLVRNDYLIIYNDGLFALSELMASQLSFALESMLHTGSSSESLLEAGRRTFSADADIGKAIVQTITSYVTTGDPRNVLGEMSGDLRLFDGITLVFRDSMVRYVVAHELGHVYLRHLEFNRLRPGPNEPVNVSYSWQAEYESDAFAARMLLEGLTSSSTASSAEIPLFELIAVEAYPMVGVLISAARDYLEWGGIRQIQDGQGTHPPSDRRFTSNRVAMDTYIRNTPRLSRSDFETAHAVVDLITWLLLPPLKDECMKLRLSGVRPV